MKAFESTLLSQFPAQLNLFGEFGSFLPRSFIFEPDIDQMECPLKGDEHFCDSLLFAVHVR